MSESESATFKLTTRQNCAVVLLGCLGALVMAISMPSWRHPLVIVLDVLLTVAAGLATAGLAGAIIWLHTHD